MRFLISIVFFLFSIAANASIIVVDKRLPYKDQGKSVSYFKDKNGSLGLDQVIHADQNGQFLASQAEVLNFGNSSAAYWLKINYTRPEREKAYLILDISNIEEIDYYTQNAEGSYHHVHSGSIAPENPSVITSNNYIFNLPDFTYGLNKQTIYIRLRTHNVLVVPLKMAVSENLLAGINSSGRLEAIYIGILLALFFFNVFVFFSSRDVTYFYYSVYILSLFSFIVLYYRGYGYLLGNEFRYFINFYPYIFLGTASIAGIAFCYNFLNLPVVLPWSKRLVQLLIGGWLLNMLVCLLDYKSLSASLSEVLSTFTTLSLVIVGVKVYLQGYRPALYYVIAKLFLCAMAIFILLCFSNIIPYSELSFRLAPIGFIFELLFISLALGNRLKEMEKVRLKVQLDTLTLHEENLYLVSSQNERLEKVVEARTRALKKLVHSLEAANADKNRLFSIIAHDLRSPFNSLISLFSLNDMDLLTFDDVKTLLNDSRRNIDNIHNTLNNLLYWAQSQMKGIKTAPSRFNLRSLVGDLMLVYQPLVIKKNIKIEFVTSEDTDVFADFNQISLVIRNLIDNAIKFTPHHRDIRIKIWGDEDHVYVDVCNPVAGNLNMSQFTSKEGAEPSYGTSNERGVGLGLHLCRDFIEKNNGYLKVSKEDECVVLRFNLPKNVIEAAQSLPLAEEKN
ncbi:sensor histidine kinase [Pedobacter sp. L105]|uniref:sensor histidine kinase n=1 Tax=Pedobacter sp. L105 TaxID=1641871 RepID=UPI00131B4869|nr:sensor histidine kinase [Pedobacter sp. L105]